MPTKFSSSKIELTKSYADWTGHSVFSCDRGENNQYSGLVFLNIKFKKGFEDNPQFTHPSVAGKRILDEILQEICQKNPTAQKIREIVKRITTREILLTDKIEIATLIASGEDILMASGGGTEISLVRNKSCVKLLKSNAKDIIFAKGKCCQGDILIFSSGHFFEIIPQETIKKYFSKHNPDKACSQLEFDMRKKANESVSAIFISFGNHEFVDSSLKRNKNAFLSGRVMKKILSPKTVMDFVKSSLSKQGVDSEEQLKRKRRYFLFGLSLITILSIAVIIGNTLKRKNDYENQFLSQINESKHMLEEAVDIYSFDKKRSRELFIRGKTIAQEAQNQGYHSEILDEIISGIGKNEGLILGEHKRNLELFVDTTLLSEEYLPKKISYSNGVAFVSDFSKKIVAKIEIDSKKTEIVAGPTVLDSLHESASYSDRLFLFTNEGLFELIGNDLRRSGDASDRSISAIGYTGNLYVLNRNENMIYRLSLSDEGDFSSSRWLSEGQSISGSKIVDFAIDGSIWIVDSEEGIQKYISGNKQSFSLEEGFGGLNYEAIYADNDTDGIFVLEKTAGRIIKFEQDGVYKAQYINDLFKNTDDFIVTDGRIIILAEGKIYEMKL